MATYLARRDPRTREQLRRAVERPGAAPVDIITALFDVLARWADSGTYRGCAFLNAISECPEDTAVRAASIAHKTAIEAWFREILAGTPEAAQSAAMLMLLYDGALAGALVHGSGEPMRAARAAAERLLAAAKNATA